MENCENERILKGDLKYCEWTRETDYQRILTNKRDPRL
jgi:hypothetical protein